MHGHNRIETPSFNSITKTISDIIQDRTEKIIIVPEWPAQAWWLKVMRADTKATMIGTSHTVYKRGRDRKMENRAIYKMWAVVMRGGRGREKGEEQQQTCTHTHTHTQVQIN
jgi:hypothetical protein